MVVIAAGSLVSATDTLPTLHAFGIDAAGDMRLSAAWRRRGEPSVFPTAENKT